MRPVNIARSALFPRLLLGMALMVVAVVGTVGTLWAMGKIELPFLKRATPPKGEVGPPPGTVAVPVSARVIPAYTKVTRDEIWDTQKGRFTVVYLKPEEIRSGMIVSTADLFGRVLDHEKRAGYVFTEDDFLPVGTRAGPAAGVPANTHRGMLFAASQLGGAHSLRPGDHIDLLATMTLDNRQQQKLPQGVRYYPPGGTFPARRSSAQAKVRVIAQDALVMTAVTQRDLPSRGSRPKEPPVEEITLAIRVEHLPGVAEALATKASLTCVMRTSRPGTEATLPIPEQEEEKVKVIEVIRGLRREYLVFPVEGGPPSTLPGPGQEESMETTAPASTPNP